MQYNQQICEIALHFALCEVQNYGNLDSELLHHIQTVQLVF